MKVGIVTLLLAVAAGLTAQTPQTTKNAAPKLDIPAVPPRPDDVATIDGMVKAYYEVVSGPKGRPRDWARDRTLYIKDIRFVPVDVEKDGRVVPRIVDHQTFAESSNGLAKEGFFEYEIHRVTERYGPIAHVWSTYESKRTLDGPVIYAIDHGAEANRRLMAHFPGRQAWHYGRGALAPMPFESAGPAGPEASR